MYSDTMSVPLFYTYSDTMSIPCLKKEDGVKLHPLSRRKRLPFCLLCGHTPMGVPFPKGSFGKRLLIYGLISTSKKGLPYNKPLIGMLSVGMTNNIGIYNHLVLRFK